MMSDTPSVVAIELKNLRNAMDQRIDAMDQRIDALTHAMDQRFDALTHEMRNGILTRLDRLEETVGGMATTLAEVHAAAVPDAK